MKKKMKILILLLLGVCAVPTLFARDRGPSKGIRNAEAIVGMSLDVVESLASLVTPSPVVTYSPPVVVQPAPATVTVPAPVYVPSTPVIVQPAPVIVQPAPVYVRPAPRVRIRPIYRPTRPHRLPSHRR